MKKQKPYFSSEEVTQIMSVFSSELSQEEQKIDETLDKALREYIQSPKHVYENACLRGVLDGVYLCTVKNTDEIAYKAAPMSEMDVNDVVDAAKEKARTKDIEAALKSKEGDPKIKPTEVPTAKQVEQVLFQQRVAKLTHALNMVILYGKPKVLNIPVANA